MGGWHRAVACATYSPPGDPVVDGSLAVGTEDAQVDANGARRDFTVERRRTSATADKTQRGGGDDGTQSAGNESRTGSRRPIKGKGAPHN